MCSADGAENVVCRRSRRCRQPWRYCSCSFSTQASTSLLRCRSRSHCPSDEFVSRHGTPKGRRAQQRRYEQEKRRLNVARHGAGEAERVVFGRLSVWMVRMVGSRGAEREQSKDIEHGEESKASKESKESKDSG